MKVTIPIMIQDPATAAYKGMATEENVRVEADFFLDGPVTKKVAVIDFDPGTGQIAPPARFVAPGRWSQDRTLRLEGPGRLSAGQCLRDGDEDDRHVRASRHARS